MSGTRSHARSVQRRYQRLLFAAWAVIMVALGFAWWKSIGAFGIIEVTSPFFVAGGAIFGGTASVATSFHGSPWTLHMYYVNAAHSPPFSELGAYDRFGKFFCGSNHPSVGGNGLIGYLPFWFLMLAISLLFLALFLLLRRRFRRWERNLPGSLPEPDL